MLKVFAFLATAAPFFAAGGIVAGCVCGLDSKLAPSNQG
jgi:hypothetical protein